MRQIHKMKKNLNYNFDKNDLKFDSNMQLINLCLLCVFAGVICNICGMGTGLILAPLLLQYNMVPFVMSCTNQYVTMIASLSVAV